MASLASNREYRGPTIHRTERVSITRGLQVIAHWNAEFRVIEGRTLESNAIVAEGFHEGHQSGAVIISQVQAMHVGEAGKSPPRL